MKSGLLVLLILLLVGCTGAPKAPDVDDSMTLMSDFPEGQKMPDKYGAKGANISPYLFWSGAPKATACYAVILEDPNAPGPTPFVHWVLFNIPKVENALLEQNLPARGVGGKNDAGTTGYFGPKPPSGTHHYVFRVYALDSMLNLKAGAAEPELLRAMKGHELGMGKLTGLYSH